MPGKTFNDHTGDTETGGQNEQPPIIVHPEPQESPVVEPPIGE